MPSRSKPPRDPSSESAVRTVALRLLTVRARGREDLARALERRGFERAAVRAALDRLVREGWLDDLAAARSVVRVRQARYGRGRIARELTSLGFSKEIASAALGGDAGSDAEKRALARAFALAWKKSAGEPPAARRRRVRAALLRRGFASEAISAMMRGSSDDTGSDDTGLDDTE